MNDLVHEMDELCAGVHCHIHHVDEDGPGYISCFECGHLFYTRRDLRKAYFREMPASWLYRLWRRLMLRTSRIFFCPECLHDF